MERLRAAPAAAAAAATALEEAGLGRAWLGAGDGGTTEEVAAAGRRGSESARV